MDVKIQFNDGRLLTVEHQDFHLAVNRDPPFRFSIGTADFYNADFYALEEAGGILRVSMWDLASSYPEQNWEQEGHASVYQIFSPNQWIRIQYGYDPARPWSAFIPPKNRVAGVLIADEQARTLLDAWPVSKLPDYSRDGM